MVFRRFCSGMKCLYCMIGRTDRTVPPSPANLPPLYKLVPGFWKYGLSTENLRLLGLVEIIFSRVNRKTQLQRAIAQVGFGEAEHEVPLAVADVRLHGEGLAKSQKVISAVA